jgi:hypothetical protein
LLRKSTTLADSDKIKELVEFGFPKDKVENALTAYQNDKQAALTFLLEDQVETKTKKTVSGKKKKK